MKKFLFKALPLVAFAAFVLSFFVHDAHGASVAMFGAAGMSRGVRQMENHAFNTFDPSESYDPDEAMYDPENSYDEDSDNYDLPDNYTASRRGVFTRKRASSPTAQLDIVIDNSAINATTTVELFNYLRSNTMIRNATYNTTTFEPPVFDKLVNRAAANASIMSDAQMIYWKSDGSLIYSTTTGVGTALGTAICSISCPQVPYRTLFEASRNNLLFLTKIRMSVKTSAQIDQPINLFKNSFLGGTQSNQIAPRAGFSPTQQQSLIVDIPMNVNIDAETGMSYTLVAQEKVTLSCFFQYTRGNASAFRH